jgi:hypothetical protein
MPTPKGFSSPTASSTKDGTPICCNVRATLSPPIPPPAMSTGKSVIEIASPTDRIAAQENPRLAPAAQDPETMVPTQVRLGRVLASVERPPRQTGSPGWAPGREVAV